MRFALACFFGFMSFNALSQTVISDKQEVSGIWTSENSPYRIQGEALVPKGETLVIEAGVVVQFKAARVSSGNGKGFLRVQGELRAEGSIEKRIRFTREGMTGYWGVILFDGAEVQSSLKHCVIEYAGRVTYSRDNWGAISLYATDLSLYNCLIHQPQSYAVHLQGDAGLEVDHSVFYGSKGFEGPIRSSTSNFTITNSIILGENNRALSTESGVVSNSLFKPKFTSGLGRDASNILGKDPMFENARSGDFRLKPGSPARGAGEDGTDMGLIFEARNRRIAAKVQEWPEIEFEGRGEEDSNGDTKRKRIGGNKLVVGKFYALLIGVEDYDDPAIPDLDHPMNDVNRVKQVLVQDYVFSPGQIKVLPNPGRDRILNTLDSMSKIIGRNDNLLIFYAGHGHWEEKEQEGFWWSSDSKKSSNSTWVSNDDITRKIRAMESKHVLLITDACFGGSIFRGRGPGDYVLDDVKAIYQRKSRRAITSGAKNEIVPDKSVFIENFVRELKKNTSLVLPSQTLFTNIRIPVASASTTVPLDGYLTDTGDEGGDFLFIRRQENDN